MIINRALLTNGVKKSFEEAIDFSSIQFDQTHIKSIPHCEVIADATDYGTILCIAVKIKATVIGVCSYSLEDVELKLNIDDELDFTDNPEEEDLYYEKGNLIDLDEYILGIILANVPVRIIKKGAKRPNGGNDFRVISEDEYFKEKENEHDSRWDALDNLDISDD